MISVADRKRNYSLGREQACESFTYARISSWRCSAAETLFDFCRQMYHQPVQVWMCALNSHFLYCRGHLGTLEIYSCWCWFAAFQIGEYCVLPIAFLSEDIFWALHCGMAQWPQPCHHQEPTSSGNGLWSTTLCPCTHHRQMCTAAFLPTFAWFSQCCHICWSMVISPKKGPYTGHLMFR